MNSENNRKKLARVCGKYLSSQPFWSMNARIQLGTSKGNASDLSPHPEDVVL